MENTTLICNEEACLLKVLLTSHKKAPYIFDNCEDIFFEEYDFRTIFAEAKKTYDEFGVVNTSKMLDNNKNIFELMVRILQEPLAYTTMTEIYCTNLCKKYINRQIQEAKTDEDLKEIQRIKEKYIISSNKIKHISDDIESFEEKYEQMKDTCIMTSYTELDNVIGSFMGGDYIALGASTGMGKTTIALNLANRLALQDKSVLYFSLEMPLNQLQNRFVCMVMGLNAMKFRKTGFTQSELELYKTGLKGLKEWKVNIVCDYRLTPEKLRMYAEKQKKKGLDFIIIDYLGLMSGFNNKTMYEKTTLLSREIKLLATELNMPILVLVQLNRDLKGRQEKRPVLSDIRESGAIEQDADFVLFAHRECIYNKAVSERDLEIIVAKNRHGRNNKTIRLDIDLSTQAISEK